MASWPWPMHRSRPSATTPRLRARQHRHWPDATSWALFTARRGSRSGDLASSAAAIPPGAASLRSRSPRPVGGAARGRGLGARLVEVGEHHARTGFRRRDGDAEARSPGPRRSRTRPGRGGPRRRSPQVPPDAVGHHGRPRHQRASSLPPRRPRRRCRSPAVAEVAEGIESRITPNASGCPRPPVEVLRVRQRDHHVGRSLGAPLPGRGAVSGADRLLRRRVGREGRGGRA